uniref:Uncharacterized protein n=1 Tax=Opuntia streptacantha TaxID=393608 RepID=A0A7C9EIS7_OPUST
MRGKLTSLLHPSFFSIIMARDSNIIFIPIFIFHLIKIIFHLRLLTIPNAINVQLPNPVPDRLHHLYGGRGIEVPATRDAYINKCLLKQADHCSEPSHGDLPTPLNLKLG